MNSKCILIYKDQEFKDKESLAEYLRQEQALQQGALSSIEATAKALESKSTFSQQEEKAEIITGKQKDRWGRSQVWRERIENAGDILREISSRGNKPDVTYLKEKVERIKNWLLKNEGFAPLPTGIETLEDVDKSNVRFSIVVDGKEYLKKFHSDVLQETIDAYKGIVVKTKEEQLIKDFILTLLIKNKEDIYSKLKDVEDMIDKIQKNKELISTPLNISEAYHKAKADGTNPELVRAVEELLSPQQTQPIQQEVQTITIQDTQENLSIHRAIIEVEAEQEYGTSEFITFNYPEDDVMEVVIDPQSIEDIKSEEKIAVNTRTGKKEEINIPELLEREQRGEEIPYKNWKEIKHIYFANKLLEEVLKSNQIIQSPQENLTERLYAFAQSLGISITTLENYLEQYGLRTGSPAGIEALADMLYKVIAVSNGSPQQLSEEVAHFAVEYYSNQEIVEKMLDKVDQTSEYQAEAARYRERYGREGLSGEQLERKVRKEILGKILAQKIQDNFNTQNAISANEIGIISQLKKLWNSFIELFKINNQNKQFFKEFGKILDNISQSVLEADDKQFFITESKEIYYSMSNEQRALDDTLNSYVDILKANYKSIANSKVISFEEKKKELDKIRRDLVDRRYGLMVDRQIALMEQDILTAEKIEQEGNLDSKTDLVNVTQFIKAFDSTESFVINEIKALKQMGVYTENEAKELIEKVKDIHRRFSRVRTPLVDMTETTAEDVVREDYEKRGAPKDVVDSAVSVVKTGIFKDIMSVTTKVLPMSVINNPLVKVIVAQVEKAINAAYADYTDYKDEFIKYITDEVRELSHKLADGYNIIAPFHIHKAQEFLDKKVDALKEQWDKKIEAEKDPIKKEKLFDQMMNEVEELREQYVETMFKDNFVKKWEQENKKKLSNTTKQILRQRTADKYTILKKYVNKDGKIAYNAITKNDLNLLELIDMKFKLKMSEYDSMGRKKKGMDLQVAKELKEYLKYNEATGNDKEKEEALEAFKVEKETLKKDIESRYFNGRKITDAQFESHPEFLAWAQNRAVRRYDDSLYNDVEGEIDVDETNNRIVKTRSDIIISQHLGIPFKADDIDSYKEIYEKLLDKRRQLVAPYRRVGNSAEIDAELLSKNKILLDEIDAVSNLIRLFVFVEEREGITYEGNDSFNKKVEYYNRNNLIKEKEVFYKQAGVKYINGKPTPTSYIYRRMVIVNEDKSPIKPSYYPKYGYQTANQVQRELNPNYSVEMQGRTTQFKKDHPEMQQFINKEFYELFGIDQKNDFWGLKGATKHKELYAFRGMLLKWKEENDKEMGISGRYFYRPQIQAQSREFASKDVNTFKAAISKNFTIEGNDEVRVKAAISADMTVPKRYQLLLEDPKTLSQDWGYAYGRYFESAKAYKYKTEILPNIKIMQEKLANATIEGAKGDRSNVYAMLEKWLSAHMYGNLVDEAEKVTKFLRMMPFVSDKASGAKTIKTIYTFIRNNRLGFQLVTPVVGAISTAIYNTLEGLSENIVSKDSLSWSSAMSSKQYIQNMRDMGRVEPKSEVGRLMEFFGVGVQSDDLLDGATKNAAYRLSKEPLYLFYRPASALSATQAIYAMVDAYRMVKYEQDGKQKAEFHNINSFRTIMRDIAKVEKQKATQAGQSTFFFEGETIPTSAQQAEIERIIENKWKTLRQNSFYNFLDISDKSPIKINKDKLKKAGFFQGKNEESALKELRSLITQNTKNYWTRIESQATATEKPLMYTSPFLMFFGMFQQYFFNFMRYGFTKQNYNLNEMRMEEGRYITVFRVFKDMFTDKGMDRMEKTQMFLKMLGSMYSFGMYKAGIQGLEEYEQTNLKRIGAEFHAYSVLFVLFLLANAMADDDEEDWLKQYLAFISSRALAEQGSQMMPFAVRDIQQRIAQPLPAQNQLEMLVNIHLVLPWNEKGSRVIERGAYEGLSVRQREILQLFWIKNLYAPIKSDFRQPNKYFQTKAFGWQNDMYAAFNEE